MALRSIVSVSLHEYVVDGAARVTEMNVDTVGNALVRFYFLEPMIPRSPVALGQSLVDRAQEQAGQAIARTGQEDAWKKVSKSYPGSTHAHTIEFRVDSQDELRKLFTSADRAFRTMKEEAISVP